MIMTLLYFILALVILITVHEFGHYWVARRCGVKVLRFSLGIGKPIFRYQGKSGTEFVISMLPLGGYIKMLDETEGNVPASVAHLAFNRQSLLKRSAIVIAGPLFNFLFAIIALWLMLVIGVYSLAPIIDKVESNSIAAQAGIQAGQEIIAFNNKPVNSWRQFQYTLMPLLGADTQTPIRLKNLANKQQQNLILDLSQWHIDPKQRDILKSLGITPFLPKIAPVVGKVVAKMPGEKAGLMVGDRIVEIDNKKIDDWLQLVTIIKNNPNKQLTAVVERQEKLITVLLTPQAVEQSGKKIGIIGLVSKKPDWPDDLLRAERRSPLSAIKPALLQTAELSYSTLTLLGRLVTGQLSVKTLSGPIGIAEGAGQSGKSGIAYYLSFLALVSISLGVLNLLPIPVLDGGHLVFYLFEWILGKPVSERAKAICMNIGVMMILGLLALAMFNDVSRLMS